MPNRSHTGDTLDPESRVSQMLEALKESGRAFHVEEINVQPQPEFI
jgi:hypothetical protein